MLFDKVSVLIYFIQEVIMSLQSINKINRYIEETGSKFLEVQHVCAMGDFFQIALFSDGKLMVVE